MDIARQFIWSLEPMAHTMLEVANIVKGLDSTHSHLVIQKALHIQISIEEECYMEFIHIFKPRMARETHIGNVKHLVSYLDPSFWRFR